MKRKEMLKEIYDLLREYDGTDFDRMAKHVLNLIELKGMLPPVQSPSLVDDGNGGQKHGPALRVWDKEDEDCCNNEQRSMEGGCINCGDPSF